MVEIPSSLIAEARDRFDLTEARDQAHLYTLADELDRASAGTRPDFDARHPLELKLAARLVAARRVLEANPVRLEIGVVFAMWGEHHRLLPKSADNPHGEDLLRVKLDQLAWATQGSAVEWRVYAVDDGCPHQSGRIAENVRATHTLGDRVRVLHLADALPADSGPLAGLASADDSRKAGAVIHGCAAALADGVDAIVYTDADNSVHLGQLGLLLEPHLADAVPVVLGTRKHPDAVLVKQEARWGVGIALLRHMQRRIGSAIFGRGIRDTQAAFKLYHRSILERILERPSVYDFSFDTDWIAATIALKEPFALAPFAFIDSFAESASVSQGPMTTWFALLKGMLIALRARGLDYDEEMASVLDDEIRSSADLDLLIDVLPPELADARDEDLGGPDLMSPAAVRRWIGEQRI
jgi:hypothetical protein